MFVILTCNYILYYKRCNEKEQTSINIYTLSDIILPNIALSEINVKITALVLNELRFTPEIIYREIEA
jgi:hypothetical protein